jgi:acetyltransferase-like isoleucine patch superfamily enzyme
LYPHFDSVGEGTAFSEPWHVKVFGAPVTLGRHVQVCALRDSQVRFSVFGVGPGLGRIHVGDCSVINPGARIASGYAVEIGDNALLASNVTLNDTDWHGRYDRVHDRGGSAPIAIEDNVWLGEGVIVCKGVRIGQNTIVGAGAVVVKDLPPCVIATGNPARVVGELDPQGPYVSRAHVLAERGVGRAYLERLAGLERELTAGNTLLGFMRYLLFPRPTD